ncbi:MAG: HK97 family phage prohead protease [Ignavibacteriae bacterium]|nr:HK97 family phage prohead protease [Ignavibacteriota bacterium]
MNTKQIISESEKTFNDNELTIAHYISTTTPDRYGDIVNPSGMDATNYAKNPVVLFGHRSNSLVIGKNLELQVRHNGVSAVTKFADTEQGREIYKLNRDGFLNAWSIGFIPKKEVEKKDEIAGNVYNHIEEWDLLEYSSVPIPANPDCLNLMLKDLQDDTIKTILKDSNESLIHYNQLSADISIINGNVTELNNKLQKLESKVSYKVIELIKFVKSL